MDTFPQELRDKFRAACFDLLSRVLHAEVFEHQVLETAVFLPGLQELEELCQVDVSLGFSHVPIVVHQKRGLHHQDAALQHMGLKLQRSQPRIPDEGKASDPLFALGRESGIFAGRDLRSAQADKFRQELLAAFPNGIAQRQYGVVHRKGGHAQLGIEFDLRARANALQSGDEIWIARVSFQVRPGIGESLHSLDEFVGNEVVRRLHVEHPAQRMMPQEQPCMVAVGVGQKHLVHANRLDRAIPHVEAQAPLRHQKPRGQSADGETLDFEPTKIQANRNGWTMQVF